jgi:hypothetical protein
MKKISLLLLSVPVLLALTGCVPLGPPSTILPMGGNNFQAITSTSSRTQAYEASLNNATKQCTQEHKSIVVVNSKYKYTGPNQQQEMTTGAIGAVASILSHGHSGDDADNGNEYHEVTLKFKCVN